METKRIYNLKRSDVPPPEHKRFRHVFNASLPKRVDLRDKLPPVYDQGQLGSCTAQAGAAAYSFVSNKPPNPSKLFLYYNARLLDNPKWVLEDSGATLYHLIVGMEQFGVCPEKKWPYDISKFKDKPTQECYDKAKKNLVTEVNHLNPTLPELKACLASNFPFVFGIMVHSSFESDIVSKTGKVPLPKKGEKQLGGHALLCCGYDDDQKVFICRNSWSSKWGDNGYCYLPYDYLTNPEIAWDFWCVKKTSRS